MDKHELGDKVIRHLNALTEAIAVPGSGYKDDGDNTIAITLHGKPDARATIKALAAFVGLMESVEDSIAKAEGVRHRIRWIASTESVEGGGVRLRLSDGDARRAAVVAPERDVEDGQD